MSSDEARAAVLAVYPDAVLQPVVFWFRIWADGRCISGDVFMKPADAWIDAARRLKAKEAP